MIVEDEQAGDKRAVYAKQTLKHISKALIRDFGRGYSVDNLEQMRSFYLQYGKSGPAASVAAEKTQQPISETLSRISGTYFQLSWSHYVQLIKINDPDERQFYEIESIQNNGSVRELQRQYHSSLYERLALSRDKQQIKTLAQKGQIIENRTNTPLSVLCFARKQKDRCGVYASER